jgi:hypothetical protein
VVKPTRQGARAVAPELLDRPVIDAKEASKRLFGRCFLIVRNPAQHDDLVVAVIIVQHSDAPPPCSAGVFHWISPGASHNRKTPADAARS